MIKNELDKITINKTVSSFDEMPFALLSKEKYLEKEDTLLEDNIKFTSNIKSLNDFFKDYTSYQIDYTLNFQDNKSKNILYLKYDSDLKNLIKRKLIAIQERKFYDKVLPRLTTILETIYPENKLYNNRIKIETFLKWKHLLNYNKK